MTLRSTTDSKEVSKSALAYEFLRERILNRTYLPGYRLVLKTIADELGTSVVPVREAVRQLEAAGLVTYEHNVGARVAQGDDRSYLQIMQLLAINEGAATALAAPSITATDLAKARSVNAEMRESLEQFDALRFTQLNREFHTVLFSRCPNRALRELVHDYWEQLDHLRSSTFSFVPGRSAHSVDEHEHICSLIETKAPLHEIEAAARAHRITTLEAFIAKHPRDASRYVHI